MAVSNASGFHPEDYGAPLLVSLGLHALVILALTLNLSFCDSRIDLPPVPQHVKAVVIDRVPAPAPLRPAPLRELKIPEITIPEVTRPPEAKPPEARPDPVKSAEKPPVVEVAKPVAKPPPDFGALLEEDQRALAARTAARREQAQQETSLKAAQKQKLVDEYMVQMATEIQRRWVPSPGARRGLQTVLRIALLPGGEVQEVVVAKSSGDAGFDNSAENAVRLAGRLPVPADPELFREFRRFTFTFVDPRR